MSNEQELIIYYNKFNEDKRLETAHGKVEYLTAIKYIEKYLSTLDNPTIADIGAGTGKYAIYFSKKYDVSAVELVKHNLKVITSKSDVKAYQGNALDLKMFKDESFDVVLLFGPMYHLISFEDKIKCLNEAKRILKPNGLIFISYCMNEYANIYLMKQTLLCIENAIITHMFKENNIESSIQSVDSKYHVISHPNDLYSFVRIPEIKKISKNCNLKRIKMISQDGPTEYLKKEINNMSKEEFKIYLDYHFKTCEYKELLGSSRHILDILRKN